MTCGKDLQVGDEFVQRLARAAHDIENDQRSEQSVAGGGEVRKEDVAGLLAAERGGVCLHHLQHIFVAYRRAQHLDPVASQRGFKTHVGHGRGDDDVAVQQDFAP